VRSFAVSLVAFCTVACTGAPAVGAASAQLACVSDSGLCAAYTSGARGVRILLVRPPSIVLLRERFVPAGEAIENVRWNGATLLIDTTAARYALDTRSGTLAPFGETPGMTASTRARRGG
jgi:hypothetical protein